MRKEPRGHTPKVDDVDSFPKNDRAALGATAERKLDGSACRGEGISGVGVRLSGRSIPSTLVEDGGVCPNAIWVCPRAHCLRVATSAQFVVSGVYSVHDTGWTEETAGGPDRDATALEERQEVECTAWRREMTEMASKRDEGSGGGGSGNTSDGLLAEVVVVDTPFEHPKNDGEDVEPHASGCSARESAKDPREGQDEKARQEDARIACAVVLGKDSPSCSTTSGPSVGQTVVDVETRDNPAASSRSSTERLASGGVESAKGGDAGASGDGRSPGHRTGTAVGAQSDEEDSYDDCYDCSMNDGHVELDPGRRSLSPSGSGLEGAGILGGGGADIAKSAATHATAVGGADKCAADMCFAGNLGAPDGMCPRCRVTGGTELVARETGRDLYLAIGGGLDRGRRTDEGAELPRGGAEKLENEASAQNILTNRSGGSSEREVGSGDVSTTRDSGTVDGAEREKFLVRGSASPSGEGDGGSRKGLCVEQRDVIDLALSEDEDSQERLLNGDEGKDGDGNPSPSPCAVHGNGNGVAATSSVKTENGAVRVSIGGRASNKTLEDFWVRSDGELERVLRDSSGPTSGQGDGKGPGSFDGGGVSGQSPQGGGSSSPRCANVTSSVGAGATLSSPGEAGENLLQASEASGSEKEKPGGDSGKIGSNELGSAKNCGHKRLCRRRDLSYMESDESSRTDSDSNVESSSGTDSVDGDESAAERKGKGKRRLRGERRGSVVDDSSSGDLKDTEESSMEDGGKEEEEEEEDDDVLFLEVQPARKRRLERPLDKEQEREV